MRASLYAHGEAIMQTMRLFLHRPVTALLSVAVIGTGLLVPVGGYILVANLKALTTGAGTNPQISVFLASDAGAADRAEIERRLRLEPGVRLFRFVDKDAALKELQSRTGAVDLAAGLPGNPLPDTYLVTPREASTTAQASIAESVRNWPKVAEVDLDAAWSDRLRTLARTGEVVVLGLGLLLGIATLAVSFNTVRLQVLTRVEEIAVLRLFGATSAYVRRPFLYFGAAQGAAAALFACLVAGGSVWWIEPRLAGLLDAYGLSGRLTGLSLADATALIAFSALVGVLGAWSATGEP